MRSGRLSRVTWIVAAASTVAAAGTIAGCGSEELFAPVLASNERWIEKEAVARIAKDDEALGRMTVVGDLDGDGIDDALIEAYNAIPSPEPFDAEDQLSVLYGGPAVTGDIDPSRLPSLTGATYSLGVLVHATGVGDVDGDGLADLLVGVPDPACRPYLPSSDPQRHSGAYLVYGSRTRLTGATPVAAAGVFLRDARPCAMSDVVVPLHDLDGDGHADFAITSAGPGQPGSAVEIFVFYGRSARLVGTQDLATADAVIRIPGSMEGFHPHLVPVGDVDGDGRSDILVETHLDGYVPDTRLVYGAATRLAGSVVLADVARTKLESKPGCWFGYDLVGPVGDLDGDGYDEVALFSCEGAPGDGGGFSGARRVYFGRAAGFPARLGPQDADATFTSTTGPFGLRAADVDGDGIRDLLVGNPYLHDSNGGVHVIAGDGGRPRSGDLTVLGTTYVGKPRRAPRCEYVVSRDCIVDERVGAWFDVGDLTGDGRADILVTAPTNQIVSPEKGVHGSSQARAYVLSPPAAKP
jgi:FG-GAP-like repeat/FG-GAP repeat